jgi:mono/diheme cytochrome c family protein
MNASIRWWFPRLALALLGTLLVMQLVPYGRDHGNPPVTAAPSWDSPRTERLFAQACSDCHSNLTKWRWYSNVAPASWLVQHDVEEGRRAFDVSRWDTAQPELDEVLEKVRSGEMPPLKYRIAHSVARLSDIEKAALAEGMARTWARRPPTGTRRESEE